MLNPLSVQPRYNWRCYWSNNCQKNAKTTGKVSRNVTTYNVFMYASTYVIFIHLLSGLVSFVAMYMYM